VSVAGEENPGLPGDEEKRRAWTEQEDWDEARGVGQALEQSGKIGGDS